MTTLYRTVLVGTDGSPTAARAVAKAAALADCCAARLVVATVGAGEAAEAVLRDAVAAVSAGVEVETRLVAGDPADALVALAAEEGMDVIVVGNKGMTGAARFLLGSVPNRVSHRAGCDVLIVSTVERRGG